ncbi:AMP-binding protein [Mycobacterium lacus]|uniref:AMP-binding protein n=1 Tax=Mycobacterium lacus TaxID=169765 RepID=UPI003558505D
MGLSFRRIPVRAVSGADVADVIFTSGTTGRPRGAMIESSANAANVRGMGDARRSA